MNKKFKKSIVTLAMGLFVVLSLFIAISPVVHAGNRTCSTVSHEMGRFYLRGNWKSVMTNSRNSFTFSGCVVIGEQTVPRSRVRSLTRGHFANSRVGNVETWARSTAQTSSGSTRTIWRPAGRVATATRTRTASGNRTFWNLSF